MRRSSGLPALAALAVAIAAVDAHAQPGTGTPFGARDARQCTTPAPGGTPGAATAVRSFICNTERQFTSAGGTQHLTLVDDVTVSGVGSAQRYRCEINCPTDADYNKPQYAIRGSFVEHVCVSDREIADMGKPKGANCQARRNPKASGKCYTTTFGELVCHMWDPNVSVFDFGPWERGPRR